MGLPCGCAGAGHLTEPTTRDGRGQSLGSFPSRVAPNGPRGPQRSSSISNRSSSSVRPADSTGTPSNVAPVGSAVSPVR